MKGVASLGGQLPVRKEDIEGFRVLGFEGLRVLGF